MDRRHFLESLFAPVMAASLGEIPAESVPADFTVERRAPVDRYGRPDALLYWSEGDRTGNLASGFTLAIDQRRPQLDIATQRLIGPHDLAIHHLDLLSDVYRTVSNSLLIGFPSALGLRDRDGLLWFELTGVVLNSYAGLVRCTPVTNTDSLVVVDHLNFMAAEVSLASGPRIKDCRFRLAA